MAARNAQSCMGTLDSIAELDLPRTLGERRPELVGLCSSFQMFYYSL